MNQAQLDKWKKEAGEIPEFTCPHIDLMLSLTMDSSVREELEELRMNNIILRELGRFWYSKCQYMVGQLDQHGIKENA